jgi:hypothetical protein
VATSRRSTSSRKKPQARKSASTHPTGGTDVLDPSEEAAIVEAAVPATSTPANVVTVVPEAAFVSRIAPPRPPRPLPEQRRGIFFDVENTSRPEDIDTVLRHLIIDRIGIDTDFTAVGNWRVIGHETARILAQAGANLVHSAPSAGVRDWSDLRIAVTAGVWLAGARPGDMIDIVSDDQAFDAVGDVASALGVVYHRLSYRSLTGHVAIEHSVAPAGDGRSRRRSRGGRGRYGGRRQSDVRHEPRHVPSPPHHHVAAPAASREPALDEDEVHTAPHDELIEVVRRLMPSAPNGVSLDQLANALREHGFRRTPGSPRLITRLKRIKELEVGRNGMIRLMDGGIEPDASQARDADDTSDAGGGDDVVMDAEPGTSEPAPSGERRRRRRRGGRRRRGRRGGGGGATSDGVVAAASTTSAPPAEF